MARFNNKLLGSTLKVIPGDFKRRFGVHLGVPDLLWSLTQLRRFGFAPKHAMDVGAYVGDWTRACLEVFPGTSVTCVEPQTGCQKQLSELAKKTGRIQVIQNLLGSIENDSIPFQDQGSGSSILLASDMTTQSKPMTTIDTLIKKGKCEPPELLKLDVQGYELEVLGGWTLGFERCQVIECELSLIPIVQRSPLFHEVVAYLYKRGFVMCDVDELIRAPSDGAVWQLNALFCKIDSPLRAERIWRTEAINT